MLKAETAKNNAQKEEDTFPLKEESFVADEEETLAYEDEDILLLEEALLAPPPPAAEPTGFRSFNINGVTVGFPYVPYESQKLMMEHMITGMNANENCLLESPTGTGKTAALLCASLAWLDKEMKEKPDSDVLVIYASRTHLQLQQVVDQLKKTPYKNVPMVILASRNQTCINEKARKSDDVNDTCEKMRASYKKDQDREPSEDGKNLPKCQFFLKFQEKGAKFENHLIERARGGPLEPWDLEDVVNFGKSCETCPYYESKAMQQKAKLVLCNYNHLLMPWIRRSLQLQVGGNIIIFDEAHNIEGNCMEIASYTMAMEKLERIVVPALNKASADLEVPERKQAPLKNIEVSFTNLLHWMKGQTDADSTCQRLTKFKAVRNVKDPLKVFSAIGFSPEKVNQLYEDLLILKDKHDGYPYDEKVAEFKVAANAVDAISSILFSFRTLFERDEVTEKYKRLEHYSVDVLLTCRTAWRTDFYEIDLSLNCLSPHVIFQSMKSARSVILASGTLSPTNSFASELGLPFRELSAPHVLGRDKIFASVLSHYEEEGRDVSFEYKFSTREDPKLAKSLGKLLLRLCQKIPHGILVFFPSKVAISQQKAMWEDDGTLEKLEKLKRPFYEHTVTTGFTEFINEYRSCATSPGGAIMFSFLRGKISEGIDFADDQARAVVTVGIPYGPLYDLKIMRKKEYNNMMSAKHPEKALVRGKEWYINNAFRALNQGFGRCVRHIGDWGAIFIVEARCRYQLQSVSGWVRRSLREGAKLEDIEKELDIFLHSFKKPEKEALASPLKKIKLGNHEP